MSESMRCEMMPYLDWFNDDMEMEVGPPPQPAPLSARDIRALVPSNLLSVGPPGEASAPSTDSDPDMVDVPKYVPRDGTLDWSQYPQDPNDPITDPTFDMWAIYAQSKAEEMQSGGFRRLKEFHDMNYGRIPAFQFCQSMQKIYNKHVRYFLIDPADKKGRTRKPGPAWPAERIWNYNQRTFCAAAIYMDTALTMTTAMTTLAKTMIFMEDSKRVRTCDTKNLDAFVKLSEKAKWWIQKASETQVSNLGCLL